MSSSRSARSLGKRSYADGANSGSDNSEESEGRKPAKLTKRQRNAKPVARSDDEAEEDHNMEEGSKDNDGEPKARTTKFEAGLILLVSVENFMCHRKFSVSLGRHLNFITGRNGSG